MDSGKALWGDNFPSTSKKLRKFLYALLVFNVLLLAWSAFDFVRGDGKIEGVMFSLGQLSLTVGVLFQNAVALSQMYKRRNGVLGSVFIFLSFVFLAFYFWFESR